MRQLAGNLEHTAWPPVVTVSLPSGLLDPEEPSGAPTPVIFNQEGITRAPGEPTESEWTPGMCTVTKLS